MRGLGKVKKKRWVKNGSIFIEKQNRRLRPPTDIRRTGGGEVEGRKVLRRRKILKLKGKKEREKEEEQTRGILVVSPVDRIRTVFENFYLLRYSWLKPRDNRSFSSRLLIALCNGVFHL